jgi:hypothetical protein
MGVSMPVAEEPVRAELAGAELELLREGEIEALRAEQSTG